MKSKEFNRLFLSRISLKRFAEQINLAAVRCSHFYSILKLLGLRIAGSANLKEIKKETNMKKKGFTLVELLVVIAIIALLMSILMPALARVRQIAYRMICGTNLSGIGKAMLVYANDSNERYPRAGGRRSEWSTTGVIGAWDAPSENTAFAGGGRGGGRKATITSSHYLLVKYSDVSPKQFVCKGDSGTSIFKLSDYTIAGQEDLTTVWDFGLIPTDHDSYTYHMPYYSTAIDTAYPVTMVSNPSSPVCSDKNPFQDNNAQDYVQQYDPYVQLTAADVEIGGSTVTQYIFVDPDLDQDPPDNAPYGNSASHQREGQNVLYVDAHVSFERHPNVGVENDNIWLFWTSISPETGKPDTQFERQVGLGTSGGGVPVRGASYPQSVEDSFLVNDGLNVFQSP
jgi:prepilin-type N-terminal cleavage/methylation domain-containing protein